MINTDRIVPVTATDLITLYGLILKVGSVDVSALAAIDTAGDFSVTDDAATLLASEPVGTLDFAEGVSTSTVYFVPAYDYTGFTIEGAAVTATVPDAGILTDGSTLYKAELSSGAVTVTQVGF